MRAWRDGENEREKEREQIPSGHGEKLSREKKDEIRKPFTHYIFVGCLFLVSISVIV